MPFWVEGMNAEERENRITRLFTLIEPKSGRVAPEDLQVQRTFVFVPDPPPRPFETETRNLGARCLPWGVAGWAAVAETKQEAAILAPAIFDLWSDSLFVMAFETGPPDDATLAQWIMRVLEVGRVPTLVDKAQTPPLPDYTLATFDWGDLVVEAPTEE
ncbi:hypothetical protein [Candidatus Thiosymbion oneisti]|nr:hypothetical protein [Candidatus Thiosymbion oneisti]